MNALIQRGNELEDRGQHAAAVQCYQQAIDIDPRSSRAHLNMGNALLALGRVAEAERSYRTALDLEPHSASALFNLGVASLHQRNFSAAASAYRRVLELEPARVEAWVGLGCALEEQQADEAVAAYRSALRVDPAHAGAAVNLSACLRSLGQLSLAREALEDALRRNPDSSLVHRGMADLDREAGRPEAAVAGFKTALALDPESVATHSSLLFAMNFLPDASAAEILDAHVRFGRSLARRVTPLRLDVERQPSKLLRIGYLSGDFRGHAVACFIAPLLEHHDRARVEVHCFHNFHGGDAITARLRSLADHWHEIAGRDDDAAAAAIRDARIDVLVDLAGHTSGGRLPVLARKPAPLQFTWLGYLCTTGLAAVDYRICDAHTDPPGLAEGWQVETPARLPDSQWCYQPLIDVPDRADLPRLSRGYWTFGSFNSPSKLNAAVVAAWSAILRAIPGSRLRLVCPPDGRTDLLRGFGMHGVPDDRLELVGRTSIQEYFSGFAGVDVALDSFPYSGGTTTCDSLFMGVPVVTVAGSRAISRSATSLLRTLGLDDWIAPAVGELPALVQGLLADPRSVAALRSHLPGRMRASTLMDGKRFAANVEAIFRAAWQRYCAQPLADGP